MRIVRELAAEHNPVAKIAFLTRLPEAAVRETLGLTATAGPEVQECLQPIGALSSTSAGAFIPLDQASLRSSHTRASADGLSLAGSCP
jgi:hypothetical protein